MSSDLFIALRYLRPRFNLVTVISVISIGGIAVGTAALIVVLSVFNGFNGVVRGLLVGFDPHIRVTSVDGRVGRPDHLADRLKELPGVASAAPFVSGRSAVMHQEGIRVIQVRGMRRHDALATTGMQKALRAGDVIDSDALHRNPIVLGSELSVALNVGLGDTVALLSQTGLEESLTQLAQPTIVQCYVSGIFQSQNKEYDAYWAYTDLTTARLLFGIDTGAMGIELRLDEFERSSAIAQQIRARLGSSFHVETWQDMHADLFAVMELERWGAFVILSLIIVVAVFNVLGSLTMTVIEKVRDIGILKTMGSTDSSIIRIILYKGFLIGAIGTAIGLAVGLGVCWLQMTYGFYRLKSGYFIIPSLPVDVHAIDVALVALTALVLASVAALYPGKRAASVVPAEAVRWE